MIRRDVVLGMAALPAFAAAAARRSTPGPLPKAAIDWTAANRFAGVIAIGQSGHVIATQAFGLASIEAAEPAVPGTRYAIGSVSKWLTTVAVMRLVDRRRLALDMPVSTCLPGITGAAGAQVRLVDLLSNTSGIPDRVAQAARTDPALRTSTADAAAIAAHYASGELAFRPGSQFDYTVLNWVIVRAILERVTGSPFVTLMRDLVFAPAGVPGIGVAEHGFGDIPTLAPAYRETDPPVRKLDPVPAFAAASGTFYADAGELVTVAHCIFDGRLLSPTSRRAMLTVRVPPEEYALGGRVQLVAGQPWAWETGKIGGYRSHLAHQVARGRTIVVLGNTDMVQATIAALVEQLAAA